MEWEGGGEQERQSHGSYAPAGPAGGTVARATADRWLNSNDSRGWGTVGRADLKGPVTWIYWSWNNQGSWASMLNPLTWWHLLRHETRWDRVGLAVE